jgi:hypothetical protein
LIQILADYRDFGSQVACLIDNEVPPNGIHSVELLQERPSLCIDLRGAARWLSQVERFFPTLTEKQRSRNSLRSIRELEAAAETTSTTQRTAKALRMDQIADDIAQASHQISLSFFNLCCARPADNFRSCHHISVRQYTASRMRSRALCPQRAVRPFVRPVEPLSDSSMINLAIFRRDDPCHRWTRIQLYIAVVPDCVGRASVRDSEAGSSLHCSVTNPLHPQSGPKGIRIPAVTSLFSSHIYCCSSQDQE